MKKLAIVVCALIVTADLSAQKFIVRPAPVVVPHVIYSQPYYGGYGYGYNPYFYGGLGLGYGYGYHRGYYRPSKLDRQISDIQNDYSDRIYSARLDNSLTGHEKRAEIRGLRQQRREAIYNARRNYYKQPYGNNYYRQPQQNTQPYNNNNGNNNY